MKILFEPKIVLHEDMASPDTWPSSNGLTPPNNFVVSRNSDQSTASSYEDKIWDLTPYYQHNLPTHLNFTSWCRSALTKEDIQISFEIRYFIFILLWKRPGSPLGRSSLKNYMQALRSLAKHAKLNNYTITDILSNKEYLSEYYTSQISKNAFPIIYSLLNLLLQLGEREIGFKPISANNTTQINKAISEYRESMRQHPPIPTRIYALIISKVKHELDEWEKIEKNYLKLFVDCISNPLLGRSKKSQITISTQNGTARSPGEYLPTFQELINKYELEEYFNDRKLIRSVKGLTKGLSNIRGAAKIYAIAFTGMRSQEASNLPYYCLETDVDKTGREHIFVVGKTTKLKIAETRWVTNTEGRSAIKISQRIASTIYKSIEVTPSKNRRERNSFPLFISSSYGEFGRKTPQNHRKHCKVMSFSFFKEKYETLRLRLQPNILEGDIKELEQIDPHRNWREESDFTIGKPWRLTDHQLRRSLALYAQRSGLVSLPSLRRQLQHITEEMSRYYARGSIFANNFIGDDNDHFGLEWQETTPVSAGLAYIRDMHFSHASLFGGHVKWFEHRLKTNDAPLLMDRNTTMTRFRNGELAYKETPLGGCTKVGPCSNPGIRFLNIECLAGCENLVGKISKLERVIEAQKILVSRIDPHTIEWKMENNDLEALITAREKVSAFKPEAT